MSLIIFYVEDDEDDVSIFQEVLSTVDPAIKYLRAKNGEAALRQLRDLVVLPDIIFFDVNMPVMDGREFIIQLKKDEILKDIPLVAYTTSSRESDKVSFEKLGVAHYLVKPNNYTEAVGEVASIVSSLRQRH